MVLMTFPLVHLNKRRIWQKFSFCSIYPRLSSVFFVLSLHSEMMCYYIICIGEREIQPNDLLMMHTYCSLFFWFSLTHIHTHTNSTMDTQNCAAFQHTSSQGAKEKRNNDDWLAGRWPAKPERFNGLAILVLHLKMRNSLPLQSEKHRERRRGLGERLA